MTAWAGLRHSFNNTILSDKLLKSGWEDNDRPHLLLSISLHFAYMIRHTECLDTARLSMWTTEHVHMLRHSFYTDVYTYMYETEHKGLLFEELPNLAYFQCNMCMSPWPPVTPSRVCSWFNDLPFCQFVFIKLSVRSEKIWAQKIIKVVLLFFMWWCLNSSEFKHHHMKA